MTEENAAAAERSANAMEGEDGASGETTGETTEDEHLAARVAALDEGLGAEVAELASRTDDLETALAERESEVEDLTERLQRTQADFQNYKKRAKRQEEQIRERATEDLVERLLEVRDNLQRALDQDENVDVREGVDATLRSFDRVLDEEGVDPIDPEPGDDVDPTRHEVLMRVESDQPAGTVAEVYRAGYEMAETVLRTAQVTVSEAAESGDSEAN